MYLSAIKPILETIDESWSNTVSDVKVSCNNKHLLCTKLKLSLTTCDRSHRLTIHFYHTCDKILIQGNSAMSPNVSTTAWFVKNYLKPLLSQHMDLNEHVINLINSKIITSTPVAEQTCHDCKSCINPSSNIVRDQPISCDGCHALFHKRCSDRRKIKGRKWNKKPWHCPDCSASKNTNPAVIVDTHRASLHNLEEIQPRIQSESTAFFSCSNTAVNPPNYPQNSNLDPLAAHFTPSTSQQQQSTRPETFPNYAIRQRSSNVISNNPELEFQKSALDACRSTIIQQEAELRKLKETLDIRNKKIMQLESQVSSATSYISSRNTRDESTGNGLSLEESLTSINSFLARIESRLMPNLSQSPINIYTG